LWVFIDREDHFEMEPDFRERMARDEGPWVEFIKTMKRDTSGTAIAAATTDKAAE
jgi:hypothetical protein